MDKKLLYESPTTDVFTVQTEGVICLSNWDSNNNTENLIDDGGFLNL